MYDCPSLGTGCLELTNLPGDILQPFPKFPQYPGLNVWMPPLSPKSVGVVCPGDLGAETTPMETIVAIVIAGIFASLSA